MQRHPEGLALDKCARPVGDKAIERCGGVYEDTRNGKLRYWIATAGV